MRTRLAPLSERLAGVRWVSPENWHLTLLFLGELEAGELSALCGELDRRLPAHSAFDLQLEGGGCFPGRRRPRVLWVGCRDSPSLREAQREIPEAVEELGIGGAESREFHAHITVGRCRKPVRVADVDLFLDRFRDERAAPFRVRSVVVYASHLGPEGPTYEPLHRTPLEECR